MATILDLPEVRPRVVRLAVEDYVHMAEQGVFPRRSELIRGLVIEKMSKSPLHCSLAERLFILFLKALPEGWVVFQERPLRLADSELEPDVSIVRGVRRDFEGRHPTTAELVVEVAVSSVELDRANAGLYAEAGVREYWIVLARERQVEVYTQPVDGVYTLRQTVGGSETLGSGAVPDLVISLNSLFASE